MSVSESVCQFVSESVSEWVNDMPSSIEAIDSKNGWDPKMYIQMDNMLSNYKIVISSKKQKSSGQFCIFLKTNSCTEAECKP